MSRMRVEGLLAAFPKLISSHTRQHTFVETDTVRYIYQSLDNGMFLLLITTKTSNIVEDLGTLRLLAKVVPDVAGGLSENSLTDRMFELIFAFDEVLTSGGYKEDIALSNIKTNLEMDSHDEKMALMLEEKKKMDAKKMMDEKAKQIKERQMEALKNNLMGNTSAPMGGMVGIGGGGITPGYEHNSSMAGMGSGGMMGMSADTSYNNAYSFNAPKPDPVDEPLRVVAKGMSLGGVGGDKKKNNLLSAMAKEDNINLFSVSKNSKQADMLGLSTTVTTQAAPTAPLTISLEERYTVSMNREGGIDSCDLKGKLSITAHTEVGASPSISVNKAAMLAKCTSNWNFATHPKVDKTSYENSGIIALKGGKPLKLNSPVGVLKWSYNGEDAAPLTINCWPDDEGTGTINVNLEFELNRPDMVLTDVNILVPLGTTDPPLIDEIDGQYKHDPNTGMMCWHHDVIDSSHSSGSLEFSIPGDDADAFFPVQVMFKSQSFLCPIDITGVSSASTGAAIPNNIEKTVGLDAYAIP